MSLTDTISAELKEIAKRDSLTDFEKRVIRSKSESRGYYQLAAELFYAAWTQDHSITLKDWLMEQVTSFLPSEGGRTCESCGLTTESGYQLERLEVFHYCSKGCLHEDVNEADRIEGFEDGTLFWTTFE